MSLPQRLYKVYCAVKDSALVKTRNATDENMLAFQELLNQVTPVDQEEEAQRKLVRGMYYSNPVGFTKYNSTSSNRVGALVLWTESKRIARFFNLHNCVHISWSEDTKTYTVVRHIPRAQRVPSEQTGDQQVEQTERTEQTNDQQVEQTEQTEQTSDQQTEQTESRRDPNRVRGVQSKRGRAYQQVVAKRGGKTTKTTKTTTKTTKPAKVYKPKTNTPVEQLETGERVVVTASNAWADQ